VIAVDTKSLLCAVRRRVRAYANPVFDMKRSATFCFAADTV
jgi:hypothetical protein